MQTPESSNPTFALDLFAKAYARKPGENVVISPASVAVALAMTASGALGRTRDAIMGTLGLSPRASLKQLNKGNADLISALPGMDPKVQLAIANAVWARQGVAFNKLFLAKNRKFYGAQVETLDFAAEVESLAKINAWVNNSTHGKIANILDQLDSDAVLFIMNAIYFKGAWAVEFDKELTRNLTFDLLNGTTKTCPMMFQTSDYPYLRKPGFQAVSLPYGSGRMSMYIFLPDLGHNLGDFVESMTVENWDDWMSQFQRTEGDIMLPRFKVEHESNLRDILSSLGMGIAFDERADLNAMCPKTRARISEVKHKTLIEVNEEGTEAAVVTSVGVVAVSVLMPLNRFIMLVNRPFAFAVRDNESGTVLFLGSIQRP